MGKLTLEQIIDCLYDRTIEPSDGLKLIQELNEQQCDAIQHLFTRPQEVLKPLHQLYRKENPHTEGKFNIPDSTTFFKWIVLKVMPIETEYCDCISRIGVSGTEHGKWTCRSCKKEVKH